MIRLANLTGKLLVWPSIDAGLQNVAMLALLGSLGFWAAARSPVSTGLLAD